jgi:hypothetical protein
MLLAEGSNKLSAFAQRGEFTSPLLGIGQPDLANARKTLQESLVGRFRKPMDLCLGEVLSEQLLGGYGVDDVAQRPQSNDQEFLWIHFLIAA